MTDNEIKKALEEWIKGLKDDYKRLLLLDAPMDCFEESHGDNIRVLSNALDLINRQQAEIEKQSQNFKVLVSDHRVLQQSFDNLKGLYEDEKSKVEKTKEKCSYFIKKLQEAEAEIDRVTPVPPNGKMQLIHTQIPLTE